MYLKGMNLPNILKKAFSSESPKQDFPTPKDTLTNSEEQQMSDLQKLLPEGREFLMYDEDSAIQVVFSVCPELTKERITNLKDHGFSILAHYNCKCCTDYVFILTKQL